LLVWMGGNYGNRNLEFRFWDWVGLWITAVGGGEGRGVVLAIGGMLTMLLKSGHVSKRGVGEDMCE